MRRGEVVRRRKERGVTAGHARQRDAGSIHFFGGSPTLHTRALRADGSYVGPAVEEALLRVIVES